MATIVKMQSSTRQAQEAITMIENFRVAIATLKKLDGLRNEAIGVSAAELAALFGIQSEAQAQAFSDRWGALLAAIQDGNNAEYAKLRDFVNAFAQVS